MYCLFLFHSILGAMHLLKQNLTEEMVANIMKIHVACLKQCDAEKSQISIAIYEQRKKQCNVPLVNFLLELEQKSQNK